MPYIHPPSKGERRGRALAYAFTSVVGFASLTFPPLVVMENRLGAAVVVWSLFILTSLPAAVASLLGRYRVEYVLLPLFGAALLVADINAWYSVFHDGRTDLISRASVATALVCLFATRMLTLHLVNKAEPNWTPPKS